MTARILIADSAPANAQAGLALHGGPSYGENYAAALRSQADAVPGGLDCVVVKVGDCEALPDGLGFADFHGIAWTGSPLNAYDTTPVVNYQRAFARAAFQSGVPGFGSCWGMQIMSSALGGRVQVHPHGLEFGIARKISLTASGLGHALYQGKPPVFDALCWHQDEVIAAPPGAAILARNAHSAVQAIVCEDETHSFWGVQYHPEFDLDVIAALFRYRAGAMARDGWVQEPEDAVAIAADFHALQQAAGRKDLAWRYGIGADITECDQHRKELANWLLTKVAPLVV